MNKLKVYNVNFETAFNVLKENIYACVVAPRIIKDTTGVVLTAVGFYEKVVEFANSGATVPIIGFGYSLAKGVMKGVAEKGWIGVITGGVTGTAAGITAAVFFGLLFSLLCKAKAKK